MDQGTNGLTPREARGADPSRLLAFTDGVFAIVITILVLDIRLPDFGSEDTLRRYVEDLTPTFVAFVISFFLVGMYWIGHRGAFSQVRYVDLNTVWLNLVFLLPVSLIPFVSGGIGSHADEPIALHLYGAVLISATVMRVLLIRYLDRHPGLLWEAPVAGTTRITYVATLAPVAVYLLAMVVAPWAAWLSLFLFFLVPGAYLLLVLFLKSDPRTLARSQDLS